MKLPKITEDELIEKMLDLVEFKRVPVEEIIEVLMEYISLENYDKILKNLESFEEE